MYFTFLVLFKVDINSSDNELVFTNKRKNAITFGVQKNNQNILDPCEAAFLQLSASAIAIKQGKEISCEELFNSVFKKHQSKQLILAAFYLFRKNYQVFFNLKEESFRTKLLPPVIDWNKLFKQNRKPFSGIFYEILIPRY